MFNIFWRGFIEFNSLITQSIHSTRPRLFCQKVVLKNLAKFTGKCLCRSLFIGKFEGCIPAPCIPPGVFLRILQNFTVHLILHITYGRPPSVLK